MFANLLIDPRATDRRRSVEPPLVDRCPFAHVPPQKKAKPAPAAGPPASVRPPQAHSLTHAFIAARRICLATVKAKRGRREGGRAGFSEPPWRLGLARGRQKTRTRTVEK
jgi:hypothetical protein